MYVGWGVEFTRHRHVPNPFFMPPAGPAMRVGEAFFSLESWCLHFFFIFDVGYR